MMDERVVLEGLVALAVKTSLLLLAAWCGSRCLRRRSAAARHLLWVAAVAAALSLPVLSRVVPAIDAPSLDTLRISGLSRAAAEEAADRAAQGGGVSSARLDSLSATTGPGDDALPRTVVMARRAAPTLAAVWGAGAGVMLLWWAAGLLALAREARRAGDVRDVRTIALCDQLARALGVTRRARLLRGPHAAAPMTWGAWRPVILLPAEAAGWSDARLTDVLRHELAHVARHDCLTQALARWLCVVHWFNPLAWLAARRLAAECELACDDAALHAGARPTSYAESLVAIAGQARRGGARPAVGTFGMAASELERRVRGILDGRRARSAPRRAHRAAAAIGALAVVLPLAALRRAEPPAPEPRPVPVPARLTSPAARQDTGTGELVPLDAAVEAAVLEAARLPVSGADRAAIERLRGSLGHVKTGPTDLVRERAVWTLSIVEGGRVVEPAIARLRHPDWRVRAYATWALGVFGDPRGIAPLIESLRDPHWRPRMHAASALGHLRAGARAVDPLIAALADSVYQVRVSAVTALGEIGDRRALPAVRARTADSYAWVRMAAAEAEARLRRR